jgi:hypothetical protein
VSEQNVPGAFWTLFVSLFYFTKIFSKVTTVLAFVRGTEAFGGLHQPKGGHDAGEAWAAVLA